MTFATGDQLGPYEIVSPLGAGGMGEVYRARDRRLSRDVAIKVLPDAVAGDADRRARFEREAQTLAALNHAGIATIHGVEESNGIFALVMELVEGPTLEQKLHGSGAGTLGFAAGAGGLAIDDAQTIARQICEALEFAHDRGIVHRDL